MANELNGRTIAILATNGVEQVELTEPKKALEAAGAKVVVVSLKPGTIQGMNHDEKGDSLPVDNVLSEVDASQFDGLMLPGGVANPDYLRVDTSAVEFVRQFVQGGKPIAAICHGSWTLIDAGAVRGKKMTSWPSLQTDLRNAGATWVDEPVVRDGQMVTSRKPDDLPQFNAAIIQLFVEATAAKQAA